MKRAAILCLLLLAAPARAGVVESQAVRAIIGEAGGEPYAAQVAVACAIRNRNSLRGVYGVNNPCVDKASPTTQRRARKAWLESAKHDVTGGCIYFGCDADAGYFKSIGVKPVLKTGRVTFYR